MKDSDVIVIEEPKLSLSDQFILPQVLIGLGTTMKHMFAVLAKDKRIVASGNMLIDIIIIIDHVIANEMVDQASKRKIKVSSLYI